MFRMSDNEDIHKDSRDISEDVSKAISSDVSQGLLRAHIEHRDPRSSPQFCAGSDHLIFTLEDFSGGISRLYEYKAKNGTCYSKIFFVKFCQV